MIPVLFNKEETTFTSLGLGEIDATVVEVERERNGIYSLYIELPFSSEYVALIEQEMQIKADAGARTKWQTFKVNRVIKDTDKKIVKVYADHISMDTINDAMRPRVAIRQQTAEGALRQWNANRISAKQYDVSSDITTVSGTTWTIDEVENARQALGGVEGSILDVWGGEFEFDNNRIILHKEMGREAPTVLEYGRNIVSLEYEELIDGIYTSIYPYASYTPRSEDNRQQEPVMVTLDELIVDGDYVGNYQNRRVQIVDFSSKFDSSGDNPEIPTQTKLRSLAKSYVKENEVGAPKITQEVDFVDLSKTLDYADMRVMEEIELNDRVPIFYPNIKITSGVKVTKTVWQPLINQYKTITVATIGALKAVSLNSELKTSIKELENKQKLIDNTLPYIVNSQGNRIWYTTPDDTFEHKVDDTWFRQNGKYFIMYRWNGSMWAEIINNETFSKELEAKFEELDRKTQEMTINISNADNKAKDALDKVSLNAELIEEHKDIITGLNGQLSEDLVTDQTVLNPKKWLTNYGELVANNGYDTTDYLPVSEGDLLSLEATETHYYKVAFYDKAKNNLGYYDGNKVVLTPNDTAYFSNTSQFNVPAVGYVRLSYSTATGGADTVKLINQNNLYTLINSGYNNALNALINANIAMQEFGENLVSLNTLNKGYWLNALGALMENSAYKTTDYIRVDAGETYQLKGGYAVYQVYFYDAEHQAVAYYDGKNIKDDIGTGLKYFSATPNLELVIPTNASYARIASSIADFSKVEFRKVSTIIADTQKALDFIRDEMLPQVSKDIEKMRGDLGEVSKTAKSSLEIIGIDRGSFYSKNRRLGAKSQTIPKGDTAEILHNGDGFEVGKVYTLSFKAECIIGDIIEWVERTRTETIPFERVVQYSDTLRPDESYVQTAGVNGQATYAWQVETVNGVETGKRTNEIRTSYSPPVNEIYIQGTKTTSTVNFTIRRKIQDLSEARIIQIGDSITMGYGRDIKIPDVVKTELGAQSVQNAGYGSTTASLHPTKPELRKIGFTKLVDSIVSGNWTEALNADLSSITYATPQTYKNSLTALSNTDFSNIDAVIIMYGTNDWAMDVELDNSSDAYDQNTYLGALRYGINKLQQAYPHLEILVAQPILWTMETNTSEEYNNEIGLKVRDYANALNTSLNMNVPVAQIYNHGITTENYTQYFNTGDSSDGTHPNSAGNAVIGQLLASEIERLIDINPAPKTGSTVNFEIVKDSKSTVNFEIKKPSTVNFNINKGG